MFLLVSYFLIYIIRLMSLFASYEFLINLHSLGNNGVSSNAIFSISTRIYEPTSPSHYNHATPYRIYHKCELETQNYTDQITVLSNEEEQPQLWSSIDHLSFQTAPYSIGPKNTIASIQDIAAFKFKRQTLSNHDLDHVYIEIGLLQHNYQTISQLRCKQLKGKQRNKHVKKRSQAIFKINIKNLNVLSYFQHQFQHPYPLKLSFTIFSSLVQYYLQPYYLKSKTNQLTKTHKIQNFQQFIKWISQTTNKTQYKVIKQIYNKFVLNLRLTKNILKQKLGLNHQQIKVISNQTQKVTDNILIKKQKKYRKCSQNIFSSINFQELALKQKLLSQTIKCKPSDQRLKCLLSSYITHQIDKLHANIYDLIQKIIKFMRNPQLFPHLTQNIQFSYHSYLTDIFKSKICKYINLKQQVILSKEKFQKQRQLTQKLFKQNIQVIKYQIQNIKKPIQDNFFIFYQQTIHKSKLKNFSFQGNNKKQFSENIKIQQNFSNKQDLKSKFINKIQDQDLPYSSVIENFDLAYYYQRSYQRNMLIVICHGFHGKPQGMKTIQNGIRLMMPKAKYLISAINQDSTEEDIQLAGKNLSIQIKQFIKQNMDGSEQVILNLVGHSMGGLIARAAIPFLQNIRFGFYCSFSTPHVGYMVGASKLIKAGLWAIRKINPIQSLQQIQMQDQKDPKKSFLYSLSLSGNLRKFKKIILFNSFQDQYVPWHSSRLSSLSTSPFIQNQMIRNILGNSNDNVHRFDIDFNIKINSIDSFIGRTAHIKIITTPKIFQILQHIVPQLFYLNE